MSSDAQVFEVDIEVAKQSETVRSMLEGEHNLPLGRCQGSWQPWQPTGVWRTRERSLAWRLMLAADATAAAA